MLARGACVEQYGAGEAYLPLLDALGSLLQSPGRERVVALLRLRRAHMVLAVSSGIFFGGYRPDSARCHGRDERPYAAGAGRHAGRPHRGNAGAAGVGGTCTGAIRRAWTCCGNWAERAQGQRLLLLADVSTGRHRAQQPHVEEVLRRRCALADVCEEIALQGLRVQDVAAYLDAYFAPNEFPAELASVIHSKSEGHPLLRHRSHPDSGRTRRHCT